MTSLQNQNTVELLDFDLDVQVFTLLAAARTANDPNAESPGWGYEYLNEGMYIGGTFYAASPTALYIDGKEILGVRLDRTSNVHVTGSQSTESFFITLDSIDRVKVTLEGFKY